MAKRFFDTGLFDDPWFMDLSKDGKIAWMYLLTKCDHAGIISINEKLFKVMTGINSWSTVAEELGNRLVRLRDNYYFIPKFIYFQYPDFPKSKVNQQNGAIKRLQEFGLFDEENLTLHEDFMNSSPTLHEDLVKSYGNGNGIGNIEKGGVGEKTWKDDFNLYLQELREAFKKYTSDKDLIAEREKYHPGVDIYLSIEKACKDFWATEAGWKNKKKARSKELDWKKTFENALTIKSNQVYKARNGFAAVEQNVSSESGKVMCEDGIMRKVDEFVTINGEQKRVGRDGKFQKKW